MTREQLDKLSRLLADTAQTASTIELRALADMDLDRIRDIKRDCSTCINLLDQLGREQR